MVWSSNVWDLLTCMFLHSLVVLVMGFYSIKLFNQSLASRKYITSQLDGWNERGPSLVKFYILEPSCEYKSFTIPRRSGIIQFITNDLFYDIFISSGIHGILTLHLFFVVFFYQLHKFYVIGIVL
jgi:hypothetical protein